MKTALARIALVLGTLFPGYVPASPEMSAESSRLVAAQQALAQDPSSQHLQRAYIAAFPATKSTFLAVFMPANFGQLYNTADAFVFELGRIGTQHPVEVLKRTLGVAGTLTWDADAVNFLQGMIIELAERNPQAFDVSLSSMSKHDQEGALNFLVSGPHRPTKEFYALTASLRASGNVKLANRLDSAAKRRISKGHMGPNHSVNRTLHGMPGFGPSFHSGPNPAIPFRAGYLKR